MNAAGTRWPTSGAQVKPGVKSPGRVGVWGLAALALAAPAAAGDWVWELTSGRDAAALERQAERLAAEGFTVQAVVVGAPEPTLLAGREGWQRRPRAADYRVVDREGASRLGALGREGFALADAGAARGGEAIALFSRAAGTKPAARDYRAVLLARNEDLAAALAGPAGEGYRVVAAFGPALSESDWLLLERRGGAPREAQVVRAKGESELESGLNRLAGEGYEVDTIVGRATAALGLGGPRELVGIASRARGATAPVAHVAIESGDSPSAAGELLAVTPFKDRFAFAVRKAAGRDYDTRQQFFGTPGEQSWAWKSEAKQKLDDFLWEPVAGAWLAYESNRPARITTLARRARERPAARAAKPAAAPPPLAPPAGAEALPADGGEPGRAYLAQLEAVRRGDLKGAKALWTGEQLARWNERVQKFKAPFGMGFSEKELFENETDDAPTDARILGGWRRGDEATLRVEATAEGARAVADHLLLREAGRWKLARAGSWKPRG